MSLRLSLGALRWPTLFVLIALSAALLSGQQEARLHNRNLRYYFEAQGQTAPVLLFLPPSPKTEALRECWRQWSPLVAGRGWSLVMPASEAALAPASDASVEALESILEDFRKRATVDPGRVYLAGEQEGASAVFYIAARRPDLWTAALAIGGSPGPAINSNRLFAANTQLVPVFWSTNASQASAAEPWRTRLRSSGYNLVAPSSPELTPAEALDWLAAHEREPFPPKVDCETGNPALARCYWLEITKFDPAQRNDVLSYSRVPPGSGAFLALGGFGYDASLPGPGLLVGWLPQNYKGPLRLNDRIVSVGGKSLADARAYLELMDQVTEEQRVAVLVQRGKERLRFETKFVLPKREELTTARVQAEYYRDTSEVSIVARGAAEVRLYLPPHWIPARITWNGIDSGTAGKEGCWIAMENGNTRPCSP